jgi:hypothetical protein
MRKLRDKYLSHENVSYGMTYGIWAIFPHCSTRGVMTMKFRDEKRHSDEEDKLRSLPREIRPTRIVSNDLLRGLREVWFVKKKYL